MWGVAEQPQPAARAAPARASREDDADWERKLGQGSSRAGCPVALPWGPGLLRGQGR